MKRMMIISGMLAAVGLVLPGWSVAQKDGDITREQASRRYEDGGQASSPQAPVEVDSKFQEAHRITGMAPQADKSVAEQTYYNVDPQIELPPKDSADGRLARLILDEIYHPERYDKENGTYLVQTIAGINVERALKKLPAVENGRCYIDESEPKRLRIFFRTKEDSYAAYYVKTQVLADAGFAITKDKGEWIVSANGGAVDFGKDATIAYIRECQYREAMAKLSATHVTPEAKAKQAADDEELTQLFMNMTLP